SPVLFVFACLAVSWKSPTGERIIGGAECWPHSQPWQVLIYDKRLSRCGGALVDEHWILTAGHCLGRSLSIHLGEHDLRKQDNGEQYGKAVKVIRHPDYEPVLLKNDIMLLRMEPPAILGDTIKIIPMAKECAPTGTKCVISGWGTTSFPKCKSYLFIYLFIYLSRPIPKGLRVDHNKIR
uniref:Peptidase S1 domain-containing protein n=1 Tax=Salvator merianae TaxID=96440 RepID=A0A8D0DHH8_SALMN